MAKIWTTHRGDEWWYRDFWHEVTASLSNRIFSICEIKTRHGSLTTERLHDLLWLTQQQFSTATLLLDTSSSETSKIFSALEQQGIIECHLMTTTYTKEVRIIKVRPSPRI